MKVTKKSIASEVSVDAVGIFGFLSVALLVQPFFSLLLLSVGSWLGPNARHARECVRMAPAQRSLVLLLRSASQTKLPSHPPVVVHNKTEKGHRALLLLPSACPPLPAAARIRKQTSRRQPPTLVPMYMAGMASSCSPSSSSDRSNKLNKCTNERAGRRTGAAEQANEEARPARHPPERPPSPKTRAASPLRLLPGGEGLVDLAALEGLAGEPRGAHDLGEVVVLRVDVEGAEDGHDQALDLVHALARVLACQFRLELLQGFGLLLEVFDLQGLYD